MTMGDPDLKEKWFTNPIHREVAEIVGFDPSSSLDADESAGPTLTDGDLELLRELASGSVESAGEKTHGMVEDLLAKLGVGTENEAIQYAIKSGVTWQ
jgi:hypothetical protein